MLRLKIFFGFLVVLILLCGVGAFSIVTLRKNARAFDHVISRNYDSVKAINNIRLYCSLLDARYLNELIRSRNDAPPDPNAYRQYSERILENVRHLIEFSSRPAEMDAARALAASVNLYLASYDEALTTEFFTPEQVVSMHSRILSNSRSVNDLTEQALRVHEDSMLNENANAMLKSQQSTGLLGAMIGIAGLITAVAWLQFGRALVQPLVDLTESIREIQGRNFELAIPVKSQDEIGTLTKAFNEMAAELYLLHQETDDQILQLNLQNRAILAAFPYPIFIMNAEHKLSQVNPAAEALQKALQIPGELPPKAEARYRTARESGNDYLPEDPYHAMLFRIDEQETFFLPRIFQIRGAQQEPRGWAIVLIDVSRFRWLDEMKTNMLSTLSHEIKTPLTSIRIVLHLLLEQKTGSLNEKQNRMVESARNDCESLLVRLQSLLELARGESGASRLSLEVVEPRSIVQEAASQFEETAKASGLSLEVRVEEDLPRVCADRIRIQQVMSNFLSNARKYSPPGGVIVIRAEKRGADFVRFTVTDQGEGVPEMAQEHIFERFYRAPGQKVEGIGLGLSISREIVHAHDGRIGLASLPGSPTEFYFDLRLAS